MAKLQEFLAENPEAKAEYDSNIAAARTEGETAGKEEMQATIKTVSPYLNSSEYPAVIGETALKVLNGEESAVTLKASVAAVDAVKEQKNTGEASAHTAETGETTSTGPQSDAEKAQASFASKKNRVGRI